MLNDSLTSLGMNIHKRNGQLVAFNEIRIKRAIGNAFKEQRNLPREVELPIEVVQHVEKVTQKVVSVITERYFKKEYISVEAVQDEVIRQLFESGFKEVAELYANYRKQHAARRTLFELYTLKKRDGKIVSFKPEKITLAIAKSFRAHNHDMLTERLLERVHEVSDKVVSEIRTLWPEGKCLDIEEVQDLVETNLMKSGFHEIAKSFILYREERAKIRREKLTQTVSDDASYELLKDMVCVDRSGQRKKIPLKELRFQLETCCQGLKNVSSDDILKEAVKNYFNEISEAQIAAANIMAAKAFLEKEPDYTFVAARLLLLKEYEEAIGHHVSFEGIKTEYPSYFDY